MPEIIRGHGGRNIKPRLFLVDGVNKLIIAKDKLKIINIFLCYNLGKSKEEKFSLVYTIKNKPETIVVSAPIPDSLAWSLYCSLIEWVEERNLPENIWSDLK